MACFKLLAIVGDQRLAYRLKGLDLSHGWHLHSDCINLWSFRVLYGVRCLISLSFRSFFSFHLYLVFWCCVWSNTVRDSIVITPLGINESLTMGTFVDRSLGFEYVKQISSDLYSRTLMHFPGDCFTKEPSEVP